MELIEVVNEDGLFTGDVFDRKVIYDNNLLHNKVNVFIINNKGELLLEKRSLNKRFKPGKWAVCSAHVKTGESLEDAAVRRVNEEIGVTIKVDELVRIGDKQVIFREENSRVMYNFYVRKEIDLRKCNLLLDEVTLVKWLDLNIIVNLIKNKDKSIYFDDNKLILLLKLKDIIGK